MTAVIPHVAHLYSLLICYGDVVDGIQLVYILQDNGTFIPSPHGKISNKCSKDSNMSKIVFKEGERLVHIEGLIQKTWYFISQLTLFTSIGGPPKLRGGPFGGGSTSDIQFSLTGDIRGIFGRTGDALDALGFYVNTTVPLSSYQKTNLIGGKGGIDFDDFDFFAKMRNLSRLQIWSLAMVYT